MKRTLRLLHIEDSDSDSSLLQHHLKRSGYDVYCERVQTAAEMQRALDDRRWDVIVSDYVMPHFSAPSALAILKERKLDIPFIILSGAIGEETAVSAMRAGAHDYLMKDNLVRLVPAIEREIQESVVRRERKHTEEALHASEKLASLGRLAATIAHEVNNPLEAVTNVLYLLSRCNLDDTARSYVTLAEQELQRVTHVVRQALAFTRVSSDFVPVPMQQLVNEVLRLYAPRISSRQVNVCKSFASDAPVPSEMRQVFSNLVVNAVDAVGNGGNVRLHIAEGGDPRNPRRHAIRFTVADNGSGIAQEHRRDIFQPFFSTKRENGNGLGLWISNEIVRKHGGFIRMRSSVQPGRSGTIFSVYLPLGAEVKAARAGK